MRKNDLIRVLQGIKGNPEIVLWNGFIEDWMHISNEARKITLVKQSREFLERMLRAERGSAPPKEVLDSVYRSQEWDLPNVFVTGKEFNEHYGKNVKKVYALEFKSRGKRIFDRLGAIEY